MSQSRQDEIRHFTADEVMHVIAVGILGAERLEVYTIPQPATGYEVITILGPHQKVRLPEFDVEWTVADLVR